MRDPSAEAVLFGRDASRQPASDRVERSGLRPGAETVQIAGGEGDHPADGVGPPQRRLRPRQDLDPLNVGQLQAREIEGAVDLGGVVDGDAVDQHQRLARRGAAHPHLGDAAEGARAHHRQTGDVAQDVGGEHRPPLVDGRPIDDPRARRVGDDGRQTGGGDDNLGQVVMGVVRGLRLSGQGKQHGGGRGVEDGSRHARFSVGPARALRGGR